MGWPTSSNRKETRREKAPKEKRAYVRKPAVKSPALKPPAVPSLKKALAVPPRSKANGAGRDARGLSQKENAFIRRFLRSGNGTQAMLDIAAEEGVTISPQLAHKQASELLDKENVQGAMAEALEKAGVDDARVAQVLAEGLDAFDVHEAIEAGLIIPTKNGGLAIHKDAKSILPDFNARKGFAELILKVRGHLKGDDTGAKIINYQSFKTAAGAPVPKEDMPDEG